MASKKGGLGRGLDALFEDNSMEQLSGSSAVMLKLNDIEPNRDQPRKSFDEDALRELADSITRHGVIQPLLVRPLSDGGYQLVAGERRWRASRLAGLTEIPAVIKDMSDGEAMELALIENLQREDLNPIEEAQGIQQLIDAYGLTQDEAAEKIGKSRSAIANTLRLLNLPKKLLELVEDGTLSAGHARALLPLSDKKLMVETAMLCVTKGFSVRETERLVRSLMSGGAKAEKKAKRRDVYYDEAELAFGEALGRKVKISSGKGDRGTIEIEFFSKEDLSSIAKLFDRN